MENVDEELSDKIDVEDIDKYRKHWEIDKHWELRKSFLLAHHETIPANRLLCLAQCYANIEVLHNGYNDEVMREVRELATKIDS